MWERTFQERERFSLPLKSNPVRAVGEVGPNQRTLLLLRAPGLSLDVDKWWTIGDILWEPSGALHQTDWSGPGGSELTVMDEPRAGCWRQWLTSLAYLGFSQIRASPGAHLCSHTAQRKMLHRPPDSLTCVWWFRLFGVSSVLWLSFPTSTYECLMLNLVWITNIFLSLLIHLHVDVSLLAHVSLTRINTGPCHEPSWEVGGSLTPFITDPAKTPWGSRAFSVAFPW